ncbi:MAG: PLP-dependent aminotransferase family protein [Xanthomonadales bacterium]|nr:PLP-dependent aminotransferase family protein [Gammaproteobacteria bacterium]NNE05408.1 PLP-dependent aminotransferase family protein [Xanthomonadales bacterium]NNL95078.1 PLP-dependent aminotransferase family protein [Xanthomonadales bacterium]
MLAIDRSESTFLYSQVIDLIDEQLRAGTLRAGDRLPSLRRMSDKLEISIPTVRQAYLELERRGRIEARPKSGYFIQPKRQNRLVKVGCKTCQPTEVSCRNLIDRVYAGIHKPGVLPLGIANPCMASPATKTLHRAMKRVMSRAEDRSLNYAPTEGEPGLKRQIAYRYLNHGGAVDPAEIIITNGGQEALAIALQAVARRDDVIALESPAYPGMLELIESLGMLALEIETCPVDGVSIDALSEALETHDVRACMLSSSVNNPLGSVSSDASRERLVQLLESRDIPLIEDDVYGELVYDGPRPKPAQFFSRKGLVLTCASFSKTAAPGYRVGWLLPGRYFEASSKLKRALSCSSGLLTQMTLTEYLASGDYDRHLKRLVPVLKQNAARMTAAVEQYFPANTGISAPKGGSVLWLELPRKVNSEKLFDAAIEHGISIMPGDVFTAGRRYRNFIRLSYGHPWSEAIEQGIEVLGGLVREMAD